MGAVEFERELQVQGSRALKVSIWVEKTTQSTLVPQPQNNNSGSDYVPL